MPLNIIHLDCSRVTGEERAGGLKGGVGRGVETGSVGGEDLQYF